MDAPLSALFVVLVTNGLFGAILSAFLLRYMATTSLGVTRTVLVGLGLAPFVITWVLNILLAFIPGIPAPLVLATVAALAALLGWNAGSGWTLLLDHLRSLPDRLKDRSLWPFLFFLAAMLFGTQLMLRYKPLVDHDILEYGTQGLRFLSELEIRYEKHHFDAGTGFYYVGLHAFGFPLLFTWEGLLRGLFNDGGDAWVRSLTPFYATLTVAFLWSTIRRHDKWVAVWTAGAFTLTLGFLYLNTIYHVDPVRLFLFSASVVLFMMALDEPAHANLVLWAVLLGMHAFVHSLGMILAPFMVLTFLLVATDPWLLRLRQASGVVLVFLFAGGAHYVVDVILGTGWLLKDITWF
jgi:hypothetical protein